MPNKSLLSLSSSEEEIRKNTLSRSGFVALVGLPNSGKSTLVNAIVGEKIAATSPVAQTTRTLIQGIHTTSRGQIVFYDTPGFHRLSHAFNQLMGTVAKEAVLTADVVVWVVSLDPLPGPQDVEKMRRILLPALGDRPLVIAATKMDRAKSQGMIPRLLEIEKWGFPGEIVPVSGLKSRNLDRFIDLLFDLLPAGDPVFDRDWYTSQTVRQLAREFIQEKIFLQMREEVPHQAAVLIEEFEESESPGEVTRITGSIFVERLSQKGILIGQKGERIREISQAARMDIEKLVGGKVFLRLDVRVSEGWRENPGMLRDLGYMPE
ncbi:MAG: GTPase Era [Nitrospirae bacterium]|jgi:GTP-binding protein Era|nr:GTPase Era [Nitrospirota bacterium]